MKEDYPFKGETKPTTFTLEVEVAETIKKMSDYTKIPESELVNTAIKRFIATHSDFFPKKK
jgi:predicted DNA-binding protein